MTVLPLLLALHAPAAEAAGCDGWADKARKAEGAALVAAFRGFAECDAERADQELASIARRAKDLQTLTDLAVAAVDHKAYRGVWEVMEAIPYEYKDGLARGVGEACAEHDGVVPLLQGAHAGLKGREFAAWLPALEACQADALVGWAEQALLRPPRVTYDEKYHTLLTFLAGRQRAEALPALEKAAVAAAEGGPFNDVLDTMQRATEPSSYREKADPAAEKAMREAMVRIAGQVDLQQARLVRDRLLNAGDEALAASLLPVIYPSRVQAGGEMAWAGAAVESCDGDAWIHWTTWTEKPARLDLVPALEAGLGDVKRKLKCEAELVFRVSEEPLDVAGEASAFLATVRSEFEAGGGKVKLKELKDVTIR